MKDFYAILGIPTDSDAGAVHEAYRQAAQQYHPDKVRHLAAEFQELAETRMRDINEAYDVLRDTEKRRAYDENRRPQKDPQRTEPAESAPQTPAPTGAKSSNAFWIALSVLVVIGLVGVAGVRWAQSRRESAVVARAQATVIFRDARDAFDNQRWEDAIVLLQQVTEVRPEWLDAWDLRWRAEITLALYRDAAASLERAIALDPTSPELRGAHARSTFMLGDVEGTRAELIWLRKNGETQRVAALLDQFRLQDADLASNLNMGLDR